MILPLRKSVVQSYKTLQPSEIPVFFNSPTLNFIDWGGGCYIKLNTHQHGTQALLLKLSGPPQGNTPDFK